MMVEAGTVSATLNQIYSGNETLGHQSGPERRVGILSTNPIFKNKSLIIKAQASGTKLYQLTLILHGLDYSDDRTPGSIPVHHVGDVKYMKPFSSSGRVQCRCSCDDFYYTYWYYDKQNKALVGPAMKPYIRKTTNRPERNPAHVPGMCKHLRTLVKKLSKEGIINGTFS